MPAGLSQNTKKIRGKETKNQSTNFMHFDLSAGGKVKQKEMVKNGYLSDLWFAINQANGKYGKMALAKQTI